KQAAYPPQIFSVSDLPLLQNLPVFNHHIESNLMLTQPASGSCSATSQSSKFQLHNESTGGAAVHPDQGVNGMAQRNFDPNAPAPFEDPTRRYGPTNYGVIRIRNVSSPFV